ncbi:MAG: glycoside hydrolase [Candidatus Kryptoniota bacterium]
MATLENKLNLIFIWHQHQPYYKNDGTFVLPWVRMHGIKDYWDMVRILDDFPAIKQTFNFTPSLILQINDYLINGTKDRAQVLSEKPAVSLTLEDRIEALKTFFSANAERMIFRYPRYRELFEKRGKISKEAELYEVVNKFSNQDFLDLQVWWNLAWVGEYSRFDPPFKMLLDKSKNFSEEDKEILLSAQVEILKKIIPHHINAARQGQIEISVSPFYHPILPLLCDTNIAAEANPGTRLPQKRFSYPMDANEQIKRALKFALKVFGFKPQGMWPAEGALSMDALKIIVENGINWTATDESILLKTLKKDMAPLTNSFLEKYFPYRIKAGEKYVNIFFRDHLLSDLIGFVYSHWSPDDAAADFIGRLDEIRNKLLLNYGEKVFRHAAVTIILDGENAWEYYQSDGKDFLRTLYYRLSNDGRFKTILPSQLAPQRERVLGTLQPGSWINANFDIWIGHPEDNKAWEMLTDARALLEKANKVTGTKRREEIYNHLLIAEGSDWCWWYGDEHSSHEAAEFDKLFRSHIKEVYLLCGLTPPDEIEVPIKRKREELRFKNPSSRIEPDVLRIDERQWFEAGFALQQPEGSMHKSGLTIQKLWFGNDSNTLYFRIDFNEEPVDSTIKIQIFSPIPVECEIGKDFTLSVNTSTDKGHYGVIYSIGKITIIGLQMETCLDVEITASISVWRGNSLIDSLPRDGVLKFHCVQ